MGTFQEQNRVSVVIPTLDAAGDLPATLEALAGSPLVREIIVADGGSRDGTAELARAAGARIVGAAGGRGPQLAAGAAAASGAWLFFLHADCRPLPGWAEAAARFMSAPGAIDRAAAYFRFELDDPSPAARRLERLVAWRCRIFALPYGDQGLLIGRALYDRIGGFAALPLMEDVDVARRLGRRRLVELDCAVRASAKRYRNGGYVRRPLRNLSCLTLYFLGLPADKIVRLYG